MGLREEKRERTRTAILEHARALFAERGYQAVKTSEIAALAGIAEGTLFNYYKTKGELLLAALLPDRERGLPPGLTLDGPPTAARAAAAVCSWLDGALKGFFMLDKRLLREFFAVFYGNETADGEAVRGGVFAFDDEAAQALRAWFVSFPGVDAETAADCVFDCAIASMQLYLFDEAATYETFMDRLRRHIAFLLEGHLPS